MAKYLTNKETQATLERIIISAEKKLILISPYLKLANTLFARIKSSAENGVKVKIVYRTNKVEKVELDRLSFVENIELKSIDDLHAKCYFNEKEMIITSYNLLDSSDRNWEMGILINRKEDKEIFDSATRDVLTIYNGSQSLPPIDLKQPGIAFKTPSINYKPNPERTFIKLPKKGKCIRCDEKISFDTNKPYCLDCYYEWKEDDDEDEECIENFCHACGEVEDTTFIEPLCYDCDNKYN